MNRPIRIYKYQPFDVHTLANLTGRQLFFSRVDRFNDPFEQAYVIDKDVPEQDWNDFYDDLRDEHVAKHGSSAGDEWDRKYMTDGRINEDFRQSILKGVDVGLATQTLTDGGVCCFAENNDDVLMWAHYADGHRGFCLEFDTSFKPFDKLFQVKYQIHIPTLNPIQLVQDDEHFMRALTTKYESWSYEKEWRLFHVRGDTPFGYGVEALARIYLGSNMDAMHKEIILHLLHGSPTKLYQVNRSQEKFLVNCESKTYIAYDYETRPDAHSKPAPD